MLGGLRSTHATYFYPRHQLLLVKITRQTIMTRNQEGPGRHLADVLICSGLYGRCGDPAGISAWARQIHLALHRK